MQADRFYQCEGEGAIPIILISKRQWDDQDLDLSPRERNHLDSQHFKAQLGERGFIYSETGFLQKLFLGLGEGADDQALAIAATELPEGIYKVKGSLSFLAQVNWALAQYRFSVYKKQENKTCRLVMAFEKLPAVLAQVNAIFRVRDLINAPPNDMGPQQLADVTAEIAKRYGAEFKQWVGNELLTANFPAIHAVGRASALEPRLLQLTWGNPAHPKVTLVGKGVCFDSGGLDIKPSSGMRLMKKDMGGAAHALGLAEWIMTTQLPIRLQVLIPAVENAIGSEAYRPGDVLTMRNGLTVEIDNTDAEGRLVLADALAKACEGEPGLILDFATLTGAARVAVGTEIAALFTPNDELASALSSFADQVKDPVWRLPLFSAYEPLLDSSVADLTNASASPYAGAITAALFLKRFISPKINWAHFDIMAWNVSPKPGKPEGGEAMGIRAIAGYLSEKYGLNEN